MTGPLPRMPVQFAGTKRLLDTQQPVPPHVQQIDGGDVVMLHANRIMVGTMRDNSGGDRIVISVFLPPCECGCGAAGRGMMFTPPPEEARELAAGLLQEAAEIEEKARVAAAEALYRARNPQ